MTLETLRLVCVFCLRKSTIKLARSANKCSYHIKIFFVVLILKTFQIPKHGIITSTYAFM